MNLTVHFRDGPVGLVRAREADKRDASWCAQLVSEHARLRAKSARLDAPERLEKLLVVDLRVQVPNQYLTGCSVKHST